MERPLLLIDIDGVLNPFAARSTPPGYIERRIEGYRVRLNPAHGPALLAFADRFDLCWATTWREQANTKIGPLIGLPRLPFIDFDFAYSPEKALAIAAFAADRPLIWLEDDPYKSEMAWARQRDLHIPTQIVKINPAIGLTARDLAVVEQFAQRIGAK